MKQGPEEKDIKSIKSSWNIHLHSIWVFKWFTKKNFLKKWKWVVFSTPVMNIYYK